MSLLQTENLDITIADVNVCRNLNLQLEVGQRWALLGCNGTGKSTLLHTLAGLRPIQGGSITLNEKPLEQLHPRQIAQQIGVLFQQQENPFPCTVLESVLIGRHPHINAWQWESEEDIALAKAALATMELSGMSRRTTDTLSGGEAQRLSIATLLTQNPPLLLLDEPTNHLDIHHQITLLQKLNAEPRRTLFMTLHDINLASRFCDHALLLFGHGETLCGSIKTTLTEENLTRLYNHPLKKVDTPHGTLFLPQ